jgi:hypothetical protein
VPNTKIKHNHYNVSQSDSIYKRADVREKLGLHSGEWSKAPATYSATLKKNLGITNLIQKNFSKKLFATQTFGREGRFQGGSCRSRP